MSPFTLELLSGDRWSTCSFPIAEIKSNRPNAGTDPAHLPTVATCFNQLKLPPYASEVSN